MKFTESNSAIVLMHWPAESLAEISCSVLGNAMIAVCNAGEVDTADA